MKTELSEEMLETMRKDLGNWYGPFYFNRKDPRMRIKKLRSEMGYTFNFAHRNTYLLLGSILAIIIISRYI